MPKTAKELLSERAKAIAKRQEIISDANTEERLLSGEEKQERQRLADEAHELAERAEQLAEERADKALQDKLAEQAEDEARTKFNAPRQPAEGESEAEGRKDDAGVATRFGKWLRGDTRAIATRDDEGKPVVEFDLPVRREERALGISTVPAGGATIPTPFATYLTDIRETTSTVRRLMPHMLNTSSGEPYRMSIVQTHGAAANASDAPLPENTAIGGQDDVFRTETWNSFKVGQIMRVTNELLRDNAVNLESYIGKSLMRGAARQEDRWFVLGTGSNMPQGVTTAAWTNSVTLTGAARTQLTFQNLTALLTSMDQSYGANPVYHQQDTDPAKPMLSWFCHNSTLQKIWDIRDGDRGNFMFHSRLAEGLSDTLLGHNIVTSPFAPAYGNGKSVLWLGAWDEAFAVRDVAGTELRWSDDSAFTFDAREYRITCRVDARVLDPHAVTVLKLAA